MSDGIMIVDAEHWLDQEGDLPVHGPPGLFRNALRMAQCIEYAGPLPRGHLMLTLILCRRRPGGVACRGTLMVVKTDRDELHAFCCACRRDEFLISNWRSTLWADGPPEAIPVEEEPAPRPEDLPARVTEQLTRALSAVGSNLSIEAVQRMIVTTENPGTVVQQVLERSAPCGMSDARAVADALMAVWNATPRPELGGKAPAEVHGESQDRSPAVAAPKVGRNEPCPCGSGRKYKRCCDAPN